MTRITKIASKALGLCFAMTMSTAVNAADIQLLGSTAMKEALDELVPLFEKASELGSAEASCQLGSLHSSGDGEPSVPGMEAGFSRRLLQIRLVQDRIR